MKTLTIKTLMAATSLAVMACAGIGGASAGPNTISTPSLVRPNIVPKPAIRLIKRKAVSGKRRNGIQATQPVHAGHSKLPVGKIPLPNARPAFADDAVRNAIRDAGEIRDLADLKQIAPDITSIDPLTDLLGGPGNAAGEDAQGETDIADRTGFDPMAHLAAIDRQLSNNSRDTPTRRFSNAVAGTPESMADGARSGLASLTEVSRTSTPMPGGRRVHVESLLGDGSYLVEDHTHTADGSTYRWRLYNNDGPLGELIDGGESSVPADEADSDYVVMEPFYIKTPGEKPSKGDGKMQTPESMAGGGLLAPNCGSAGCNEIRNLLNGGSGYVYRKLSRGGRIGPTRDGADHGAGGSTRFVSESDLVGQPAPDALQDGSGGKPRRYREPVPEDPRGDR